MFNLTHTTTTVLFLKYLLTPLGVFADPCHQKFERTYSLLFLLAYSFFLVGQLKAYENLKTLLFILDNTMYILGTVYSLVLLMAVWKVKHEFHNLLAKITDHKYLDDSFYQESDAQLKKLMQFTGPLIVISYIGIMVYPILNGISSNVSLGSPSTFIYLSWYPWNVDTVPKYACTILLQICSATMICSVVGCVILFVIYCIVIIQSCGHALIRRIRVMEIRSEEFCSNMVGNKSQPSYKVSRSRYLYHKHMELQFRHSVECHQYLIR